MNNRIFVFCPNPFSLYTTTVCEMLIREGYEVDAIIIKRFTAQRFFSEFSRDGKRLLKKIWKKLILRQGSYAKHGDNIVSFREANDISVKNVNEFRQKGVDLVFCNTLNDGKVEQVLRDRQPRLVVFTGGGIIRENILELAGDGIINCHMGILPKYKGMDLPEWAILENNPDQIGITLHFMDKGIDTGDVLKVVRIPLADSPDIKDLRTRFEPIMAKAMFDTVVEYLAGDIKPEPQEAGPVKQYFIVHPRLYALVNQKMPRLRASHNP